MDEVGFQPIKLTTNTDNFKALILDSGPSVMQQLNIESWWLCSNKHEEYFILYNMYCKDVTKQYYAFHCKELICLMRIDGTASRPE